MTWRRPRRLYYRWLLPVLWTVTALFARSHPGDEYGIFFVGSIAGFWCLWFPGGGNVYLTMTRVMVAGVFVVALAGWCLDALLVPRRAWWVVWPPLAAGIAFLTIQQYPSVARAVSKNGSILAYVLLGMNLGLYCSTILLMIAAPVLGWCRRRPRAGCCQNCGYDLRGSPDGRCPECGAAASPS